MPSRAMRCGSLPAISWSLKRMLPEAVASPMIALIAVERPTPLRPRRLTISPRPTANVTPCRTWLLPYQACMPSTSSMREARAQVGFAHGGISADLLRRAGGEDPAVDQDRDAVGEPEDHVHVVL